MGWIEITGIVWALHLAIPLHGILWLARRNERIRQERNIQALRDRKYYMLGRRHR